MTSLSSGCRSDEICASTLLSPSCLVSGRARSDVLFECWNERTGEDRALGCLLLRPRSSNLWEYNFSLLLSPVQDPKDLVLSLPDVTLPQAETPSHDPLACHRRCMVLSVCEAHEYPRC